MKTYTAIGYPEIDNFNMKNHNTREEWVFQAHDKKDAERKAFDHFWYFRNIAVYENN